MNNKTTNKPPFKVKCTHIVTTYSTVGKEYDVVEAEDGFYKIKQEFSVGDKVVINKISDGYVSLKDENVKEGDIATVIKVSGCDLELSNANWKRDWWFSRNDLSLADNSSNYNLLTHQEVIQATLDDKDVEIQYTDGTWVEYDKFFNKVFLVGKEFEVELPFELVNGNPTVTIYEHTTSNEMGYNLITVTFVEDYGLL